MLFKGTIITDFNRENIKDFLDFNMTRTFE